MKHIEAMLARLDELEITFLFVCLIVLAVIGLLLALQKLVRYVDRTRPLVRAQRSESGRARMAREYVPPQRSTVEFTPSTGWLRDRS